MSGVLRNVGCESLSVGGVEDHVHLSFRLATNVSLSETIRKVKANSSKWIHDQRILERSFAWQRGYAAFSVSESRVRHLLRYIATQEDHHRKMTFQDEVRLLLNRNGIPFNEKYLWD
jgi:REP element-mobilizing transposase RayT